MKKILCALLAVLMMMSIVGCSTESAKFDAGKVVGNVYTNEYAGLTFTAPDGWTFASDEEIADLMGISMDLVTENEAAQKIAELTTVYGMMAKSADQLSNVQVVFENTALSGSKLSAEEYVEIIASQLDTVYDDFGATYEASDIRTIKIGANEYIYMDIFVDLGGVVLEQGYACRKVDSKYMANIVITAYEEGGAAALLECFN